ncbi:MAG: tRNA (adenosine(37)-N6)-threonylcarbamoyltransferase complex ATPase subunit type 1 TsaE [Saprospiraceae bacterium]|jgi:tRNA threonylcarbamoyladenosine biosynthesis protein TsaE|nr:tRNA (adenosine(37)-N6)-threonylcarbamoyltransferase complex ATPase subunit type 1 TsaE [Saprospiraceae bacterium]
MELIVKNINELEKVVQKLLGFAKGRKKMLFTGEIGAGKTTFIKEFCKHLKVNEHVTSPTFSLVNEYSFNGKSGEEELIHHIDLYRLKNAEEALDIGIEEYLYDDDYCLIEWPEIIENLLPEEVIRINFEITEESTRKILFL